MFVKRFGSGPHRYFCLHGWSGDYRSYAPLAQYLPSDATLYSADLPGCGASPLPPNWNLESVTQQIVSAIGSAAPPVTLIGNCIGALLGLCAAAQNSCLIDRLILLDTFAAWPWYFRVFLNPAFGDYAYATTFANPVGRWITNLTLASRRAGDSNLTEGFANAKHRVQLNYLRVLRQITSPSEFANIEVPVDLVYGSRSFREVRQSVRTWRSLWPHARIWEIPDAGHLLLTEAPGTLSEIIFRSRECTPLALSSPTTRN